jgi:hypothetical protein
LVTFASAGLKKPHNGRETPFESSPTCFPHYSFLRPALGKWDGLRKPNDSFRRSLPSAPRTACPELKNGFHFADRKILRFIQRACGSLVFPNNAMAISAASDYGDRRLEPSWQSRMRGIAG